MTNRRQQPPQQPEPDTEAIERAVGELRRRLKQAASPREAEGLRRSLGADVPVYGLKAADSHRIGLELVRRLLGRLLSSVRHGWYRKQAERGAPACTARNLILARSGGARVEEAPHQVAVMISLTRASSIQCALE